MFKIGINRGKLIISDPIYIELNFYTQELEILKGNYSWFNKESKNGLAITSWGVHENYIFELEKITNQKENFISMNSNSIAYFDYDYFYMSSERDVEELINYLFLKDKNGEKYTCYVIKNKENKIIAINFNLDEKKC